MEKIQSGKDAMILNFRRSIYLIIAFYLANTAPAYATLTLEKGLGTPYPAPQIAGITAWINSQPLQLENLKGKVVLIDFWTYSCINCKRTLPYLKDWYNKYHSAGLEIIGVHTPEFEFEKDLANVKNALLAEGIKYPVALDNQFKTWENFHNRYWPAHYLIDKNGKVVYEHFGEGEYAVTENNIRFLLGKTTPASSSLGEEEGQFAAQTPETYLGFARANSFASRETAVLNRAQQYSYPNELLDNSWALQGAWIINADRIVSAQPFAGLKIHFNARKVFMVMGSATGKPISVQVLLNGEEVSAGKGDDVVHGRINVDKHTLYSVLFLPQFDNGVLQVIPSSPGLEVYTFTFG